MDILQESNVIISIYNVEVYIATAIGLVTEQTYRSIGLIQICSLPIPFCIPFLRHHVTDC